MVSEGLIERQARDRFFMLNRKGLLHDGMIGLREYQQRFAQPCERVASWGTGPDGAITLVDVVRQAQPTILIGASGQSGAFTAEVVRTMAQHVDRPIIFPLSNPTSRAEATPADLLFWTDGRALIATGSPFEDVSYAGRRYPIAQCNNSYVFPGVGLGVLAVGARSVTDAMFHAAARALADCSPARTDSTAALLPPLSETRRVSRSIALAVAAAARHDGIAQQGANEDLGRLIDAKMWQPRYLPMRRKKS
jgi:malate dehydrogenase (oxaloacetate-decarboxylating)